MKRILPPSRRQFSAIAGAVSKFVALGTFGLSAKKLRSRLVWAAVAPPAQQPVRPPGALPEDAFRADCTRCYLCGEVCPVQCIRFPSRIVSSQPAIAIRAPIHPDQGEERPE